MHSFFSIKTLCPLNKIFWWLWIIINDYEFESSVELENMNVQNVNLIILIYKPFTFYLIQSSWSSSPLNHVFHFYSFTHLHSSWLHIVAIRFLSFLLHLQKCFVYTFVYNYEEEKKHKNHVSDLVEIPNTQQHSEN